MFRLYSIAHPIMFVVLFQVLDFVPEQTIFILSGSWCQQDIHGLEVGCTLIRLNVGMVGLKLLFLLHICWKGMVLLRT